MKFFNFKKWNKELLQIFIIVTLLLTLTGLILFSLKKESSPNNFQTLIIQKSINSSNNSICDNKTDVFAIIGDYGQAGENEKNVADLVKSWNPNLILTVGDNNYDLGSSATIDKNIGQYYSNYIYPYKGSYSSSATTNLFFPTLGNHDYAAINAQPYLDYFSLPGNERYYDFVYDNIHFFALDSNPDEPDGVNANSAQANWLKNKLAQATEKWKVVYLHHPPYSSGKEHGSTKYMQWPFKDWGADVVISGHEHDYERLSSNGVEYFVDGLGGKSIYNFGQPIPESQFRYNSDYGAMKITSSNSSLKLEFLNVKNQLIDSYEIKNSSCS